MSESVAGLPPPPPPLPPLLPVGCVAYLGVHCQQARGSFARTIGLQGRDGLPPHPRSCRGKWAEGKAVLQMLRGTDAVDAEYADM